MDRRVRKTKAAITDALLTLSKKKKLSAISVRELAEAADIPRSTFYLHYHCIDDVIHEYLDEYTRDMSEFMKKDFTMLQTGNRQLFLLIKRFQKQDGIQDEQLLHDMALFSAQGSIALIIQWIHQGFPCSPEEMTDRIVNAIRAYTSYFTEMFPL